MKQLVLVIELDVPDETRIDDFDIVDKFGGFVTCWSAYEPLEDNAPIRLNITAEGVEEV